MAKSKLKIRNKGGEVVEVEAEEVVLFGWLKTFVHRGLVKEGFNWVVCEWTTGLYIVGGDTRKKATDRAREVVDGVGKEKVLEYIAKNEKINPEQLPVLLHRKPRKVIQPEQDKLPL